MQKRILFTAVIVVGFILLVESLSALSLFLLGLPDAPSVTEPEGKQAPTLLYGQVIHPYTGFVFNYHEKLPSPDASHFYGFDNPGGIEVRKRSPGKILVAITGGSVAYQLAGNGRRALEEALRAFPEYSDKQFSFVSLAIPGFKQPQQLMTLAYFLSLGAEYDILINLDGFNEISLAQSENIPRGVAAVYPRSWEQRVDFQSIAQADAEIRYLNEKRAEWKSRYEFTPLKWSWSVRLAWALLDKNFSQKIWRRRAVPSPDPVQMNSKNYVRAGPSAYGTGAVLENLTSIWSNSSRAIAALAKANDIRYFHFLQPNQYVAGSKPMSDAERRMAIAPGGYGQWPEKAYPSLQREGEKLVADGIHFHDVTSVFKSVTNQIYVDVCCHVTAEGDNILAKKMGELIVEDMTRDKKTDQSQ